jgi:hypothetical protein
MAVMTGFSGYGICGQWNVLSQPQGLQPRQPDDRQPRAFEINSIHVPANELADLYRRALCTAPGTYPAPGCERGACDRGNRRER